MRLAWLALTFVYNVVTLSSSSPANIVTTLYLPVALR